MAALSQSYRLRCLAVLYLSLAYRPDTALKDAEAMSVAQRLLRRRETVDRGTVESLMADILQGFAHGEDRTEAARESAYELRAVLSMEERADVLTELVQIALVDGVGGRRKRSMLRSVAETWGVTLDEEFAPKIGKPWGLLHDLAYIYLVLAHGTDNDLSETELQVMLNKLREWQPEAPPDDVRRMLRLATSEYAQGQDVAQLEKAISSVRSSMPREQRMAALNDLVKIANADGVFLDDEEDLLNRLQTEWEVDPSANYEPHSDKSVDG